MAEQIETAQEEDVDKRISNKPAIITLGVSFLIWLLIAGFAFSYGDVSKILPPSFANGTKTFFNLSRLFTIIYHILLCGGYTILLFIALRCVPKISYITLGVFWTPLPISLVIVVLRCNVITVYATIVCFFSVVLTANLIGTEWLDLPERVVKEACKAILASPAAILFSMAYYLISAFFIVFVIVVHAFLNSVVGSDDSLPIYIIVLMILNGVVCLWAYRFVFNVGCMALAGIYALWFWGERKSVNCSTVFYSFKLILRYHLGTIACSTSLLGGGKVTRTLVKYLIERYRKKTINRTLVCFSISNLFDRVIVRLIAFFALANCVIKGQHLQESIDESFGLYLKNPRRSLVAIKVIECLLITKVVIISLLMLLSLYGYLDFSSANDEQNKTNAILLATIGMGSLLFVLPVMAMLYAACHVVLLCYLEDSELNDGSAERPYAMSDKLRHTLDYNHPPSLIRNKLFFCAKISSKVNVYRIS